MTSLSNSGSARAFTARRPIGFTLVGLAVLASLLVIVATPVTSTVVGQGADGRTVRDFTVLVLPLLFTVAQIMAVGLVGTATVFLARGRQAAGRRVLLAGGLIGLIPAVVPGLLALAAWYLFGGSTRRRP